MRSRWLVESKLAIAAGAACERPLPPLDANLPTERLRLLLAYDGRAFSGWQSQPTGEGVQDHLRQALGAITRFDLPVIGSGRTDAGVHALGQVAHVDVPAGRYSMETWQRALNANLPGPVRVLRCRKAPFSFHAQHSAKCKTYVYRVCLGPVLHPFELGRAWHYHQPITGLQTLAAACELLTGTHDFAAFAANRGQPERTTVRTLYTVQARHQRALLTLRFEGNGFLYRMVRLLTGSLMQVATARQTLAWLRGLLDATPGQKANHCAPPDGLYLCRVRYAVKKVSEYRGDGVGTGR